MKKDGARETLRKEVVSLFAFVSRQNDWFAEKSFYDIIITSLDKGTQPFVVCDG